MELKEIKLLETTIYDRELFKTLYEKILHKDDTWHFFYEGTFSVIRCKGKYVRGITKFLDERAVYYLISDYEEDQEITKKYLKVFLQIFHGYSVLAMTYEEDEILPLFHRIVHCFLNPMGSIDLIEKYNYTNCAGAWESHLLSDLAISHAHSRGRMTERAEIQKSARTPLYVEK